LGAEAKSGDLLDLANQEQALDEAHRISEDHAAAEDHAAVEEHTAVEDHTAVEEHVAAEDQAAEPILNSEINASGAQPTQTSTFPPESK
jgi:hypothetical protein